MATQPTNAGIDFQQRVSAWILINMFLEMDISVSFDFDKEIIVKNLAFESSDIIDDLVVTTTDNNMFFQMKRSVSLTADDKSDFNKALYQFVKQYSLEYNTQSSYILVTSSKSSRPIKEDLRKILNSIRYNTTTFTDNPLTLNEQDSYNRFISIIRSMYHKINKEEISDQKLLVFLTKVFICVVDIEDGMPFEKVILLTIKNTIKQDNPRLFWAYCIKNALSLASQRMSLNKEYLVEKWNSLFLDSDGIKKNDNIIFDNYLELNINYEFQMARDVILGKLLNEHEDFSQFNLEKLTESEYTSCLFIVELFRFEEDGTKRLNYSEDRFLTLNGLEFEIIHRASTNTGMERYIIENEQKYKDKEIVILPANNVDEEENTPFVQLYKDKCITYHKNNSSLICIHCNKAVSGNDSYFIEVDDLYENVIIGLAHNECLRPMDRVLGILKSELFEEYDFLNKFDYGLWLKSIRNSQAFMGSISMMNNSSKAIMIWNPYNYPNKTFDYCIRVNLENGDFRYTKSRGSVDRFNKSLAKKQNTFMNEQINKNTGNNTFCFTSKSNIFGTYEYLVKVKSMEDTIIKCVSSEIVRYTEHIGKQHNEFENFYAPICYLKFLYDEEEIFEINDFPVLISNPFLLKEYIHNWKNSNIELTDYEVVILPNDLEFDNFVRNIIKENKRPVINPIIDLEGEFVQVIKLLLKSDLRR
ncbi:hypothetical protein [Paenibacillus sp.]|uniref:hypothetical protein n=1 Tax=Paenibacillus sp. TaxID=58172 RepID=UPI0028A96585|nr:hypothetical protein [Paenibacillus sp.]